ncbi:Mcm2-7 hexameric complex component [Trebouxia sp. C0010 RCD-2024]
MGDKMEYSKEAQKCHEFMDNFTANDGKTIKYREILFTQGTPFLKHLLENTKRYQSHFASQADVILDPTKPNCIVPQRLVPQDTFDVLMNQRQQNANNDEDGAAPAEKAPDMPPELLRRFEVAFKPLSKATAIPMRQIGAAHIGKLVSVKGICTHVTDVKPHIIVATYTDAETGYEVYQHVTGRQFNPLDSIPKELQLSTGAKGQLTLETRGSRFMKYQELKMQELAIEVPQGATPRSLHLQLKGELTRSVKPGDSITMTGIHMTEPYTGFRAMKAGLLTNTFTEAMHVDHNKQSYADLQLSSDKDSHLEELSEREDIYGNLAASIAPEIFGHEDVKKALLLCMVGGVTRHLKDGMKLRGDIHLCLMGDPGVAKSQLIKYIAHISPRAVYTTGKGSSGVGLTAAVQRDPVTSEMVLEGGALVLADKGICCIDEFDKMDEGDRTAIHEVMEQQTVSIAKAGITTTLNTRTTVLAAANPAMGRYDPRRSPTENINLPAALLSRFDLMWLILDKKNAEMDRALCAHVMSVHKTGQAPERTDTVELLDAATLRSYIAKAKQFNPHIPEELTEYVAVVYSEMRADEVAQEVPHSYTTARTLLSILRLSQALARLRFADHVDQADVDEALRLMLMSKISLRDDDDRHQTKADPIVAIYGKVREDILRKDKQTYTWEEAEQIRQTLEDYESSGVWNLERDARGNPSIVLGRDDMQ